MGHKVKYLFPLCLVLFIDSIGTGLALPILPELFLNSQYGLVSGYNSSISNFLYGLSLAVVPLSSLIGLSFFGALSDVHGRKSMIIVGLIGIFISYLISILSVLFGSIFYLYFLELLLELILAHIP
jgi:DHA1 family tetracycline resistance protein-like MFS transporter